MSLSQDPECRLRFDRSRAGKTSRGLGRDPRRHPQPFQPMYRYRCPTNSSTSGEVNEQYRQFLRDLTLRKGVWVCRCVALTAFCTAYSECSCYFLQLPLAELQLLLQVKRLHFLEHDKEIAGVAKRAFLRGVPAAFLTIAIFCLAREASASPARRQLLLSVRSTLRVRSETGLSFLLITHPLAQRLDWFDRRTNRSLLCTFGVYLHLDDNGLHLLLTSSEFVVDIRCRFGLLLFGGLCPGTNWVKANMFLSIGEPVR